MSAMLDLVWLLHGGKFVDKRTYVGWECLDINEYDILEFGDTFIDELLIMDCGYYTVVKYAFKDRVSGDFMFVNDGDEFREIVVKYIDYKKVLEIYYECTKEEEEFNMQDEVDNVSQGDIELDTDLEVDNNVLDDGIDDDDFSNNDKEFLEARTKARKIKRNGFCVDSDKEKLQKGM